MECRLGCGACCIAPSISSLNKPAGERCRHLNADNLCAIFGQPERPKVCADFKACAWVCGSSNAVALTNLIELEQLTS
ncbi:YkgJ family cysteine cluster protein [uncultured Ferrimonas sp.]|uniref:YkgJ family cysteine cluster protein n=1 Tax=uncultured Ferrimonas sp. TaxID=432640 RepID=UPI002602C7AB|nr:YkgJ family cysteine cluster protein [uncultured Ferrimonas sp.]